MNLKALLEKFEEWRYHREALRFMKKRYKQELASHKVSESYLVQLIMDYPGEDIGKGKLRNDLIQSQHNIKNLELLLKFLKEQK